MRDPIDHYLSALARRLSMTQMDRDATLSEARTHLEDRAASLRAEGVPDDEARRQAVMAFGDVRRISRQLNAAHPNEWVRARWISGIVIGVCVTWALWLAGTLPAMVYHSLRYPVMSAGRQVAFPGLIQATPLTGGAFYAYLALGWLWLLPLLALYCVVPFLWGSRARRWWTPGLAFGLGAWLAVPWFAFEFVSADWAWSAEGRIVALALPLALAASYAGWRWRRQVGLQVEGMLAA
ncbi:MAG: permease prefix domain 1-containing protein [Ktedonobacterales bacterium]